jgi:hypothetical protein
MVARNRYEILPGGLVAIRLTQGFTALVDLADFSVVAPFRWCAVVIKGRYVYAQTQSNTRRYWMHRMLMRDSALVDHKNGNGLDNRRCNMRAADHVKNAANAKVYANTSTGHRGVDRRGRGYRARIQREGKRVELGTFGTLEEASRARDAVAEQRDGDFARLNTVH